jgi:magnesium transporter
MVQGILTQNDQSSQASAESIRAAVESKSFFWLDLDDAAADGSVTDLLTNQFKFHPLAVSAAESFSQRPRLDDYDTFIYLVARGADPDAEGIAEVHCFWTDTFVVTVHRGDCPAIQAVRDRVGRHHASDAASPQIVIVYLILDSLVDSFFPVLSAFDDKIDDLEGAILKTPTEDQLGQLFAMKRNLMEMRKVIAPQRDMMASINAGISTVPGMTDAATKYFRDLYDHLIRLADLVDSYRDLLSSVMDTHLSTVSNRLNLVMKQLAIIATVFLPLSYLTGFFGQNFTLLTTHFLVPGWTFWALGVGTEVVAVVGLVILFRRRGWLGGPTV